MGPLRLNMVMSIMSYNIYIIRLIIACAPINMYILPISTRAIPLTSGEVRRVTFRFSKTEKDSPVFNGIALYLVVDCITVNCLYHIYKTVHTVYNMLRATCTEGHVCVSLKRL